MSPGWHRHPPPPGPLLNRGGEWWCSSPPCQGGVGVVVVNSWPGQRARSPEPLRDNSPRRFQLNQVGGSQDPVFVTECLLSWSKPCALFVGSPQGTSLGGLDSTFAGGGRGKVQQGHTFFLWEHICQRDGTVNNSVGSHEPSMLLAAVLQFERLNDPHDRWCACPTEFTPQPGYKLPRPLSICSQS